MLIVQNPGEGVEEVERLLALRRIPGLVLIAGPTCGGKSHFSRLFEAGLKSCSKIVWDDYFKNKDDPTLPMIGKYRTYDAPDSCHRAEIQVHVAELMAGNNIRCPVYDIRTNTRCGTREVRAAKVIIVDGLYAIRELARRYPEAVKVYVDADPEIRLKRRIIRNKLNYGISEEATRWNFSCKVMPLHEKYGLCQKAMADLVVISNGGG